MFSSATATCTTILYHPAIYPLYIYEIYLHNMELQVVRKEYNVIVHNCLGLPRILLSKQIQHKEGTRYRGDEERSQQY